MAGINTMNKYIVIIFTIAFTRPVLADDNVIIFVQDFAPYISINQTEVSGTSMNLLKDLFDRAQLKYELKSRPFKRSYETVLGNTHESKDDQCLFPMQATQENAADFKWVGPLMVTESGFFAKDVVIRNAMDFKGKTVGSYIGSVDGKNLEDLGLSVEYTSKTLLNILKVDADRMYAFIDDIRVVEHIIKENNIKNLKMVYPYKKYLNYLACSSKMSGEIHKRLEESLASLFADGSMDMLR
jgi:Bacterial extracellular solute-binding proteins, family 3.